MEEDCNSLAADCIVISCCCCCHCMVLQIIVFVAVGLPRKLVRKTSQLCKRSRNKKKKRERTEFLYESDNGSMEGFSLRDEEEDELLVRVFGEGRSWCNLGEVERVLGEFVERGAFGFGSFWGRPFTDDPNNNNGRRQDRDPFDVVQLHLIEVVPIAIHS